MTKVKVNTLNCEILCLINAIQIILFMKNLNKAHKNGGRQLFPLTSREK